jgi:hypothetical protein
MRLRKKYRLLTTSGNINEVKLFCFMKDDLAKSINEQPMLFTNTFYNGGGK